MIFKYSDKRDVAPVLLQDAVDLSGASFFTRGSVKEVLTFISRTVVQKSSSSEHSSVSHEAHVAHVHVKGNKLACVVLTDKDYPARVAHDVIRRALEAFEKAVPADQWASLTADKIFSVPEIAALLTKSQSPAEIDQLLKLQSDVDEVKEIMTKTMGKVLDRGETLEDLMASTDQLSATSKTFVKQTKKLNRCC
jgi:synaptobrevin family protein YKT6